jgi:secondary thiamine-phosphate synthase enzyme
MLETIHFKTEERQVLVNIMNEIKDVVRKSGVKEGLCCVYCPHTTAGLVVNSYMDPNTPKDILNEIDRLIPTKVDFLHTFDTPSDAAGHVKSSLLNIELTFIINDGELLLGHSQGILFAEFDGPRNREVHVKVVAG